MSKAAGSLALTAGPDRGEDAVRGGDQGTRAHLDDGGWHHDDTQRVPPDERRRSTTAVDPILDTPGLSDADKVAMLGGTAMTLLGIKA
jgi:hypothetical protein